MLHETTGTTELKAKIKQVIPHIDKNKLSSFDIGIMNEGNTHFYSTVSISISGKNYSFISTHKSTKTLVYPNQKLTVPVVIDKKLEKGDYHALITFQYSDKAVVIDKPFQIN